MEIKVEIGDVELANSRQGGRYDLHCKVETLSDEFVNSSIVDVEPRRSSDNSSITPSEWPTFTYNFRTSPAEAAIFFKLSSIDTSAGGEELIEIASGFVPYQFNATSQRKQVAIMSSPIEEGIPLKKFEGKILFDISYSCSDPPQSAGNSSQNETTIQWTGMNTAQNNLPLISAQPLFTTLSHKDDESDAGSLHSASIDFPVREEDTHEEEEAVDNSPPSQPTIQELILREESSIGPREIMFPSNTASVVVLFHAVNLPTQLLNRQLGLQPVSCFANERETSNRSGAFCKWVGNGFGSSEGPSYSYLSVLKSVRLKLAYFQPPSVGLYLFSRALQEPLLSAYEDTDSLLPFSFYHRVWAYGVENPVFKIDQYLQESSYALTSVCLVPPQSDYSSHQGLEIAVTSIELDSVSNNEIVLGGRIIDDKIETPHSAVGPPFISSQGSQYKIALLQSSDAAAMKCYLFFGTDSSTNLQSLKEHKFCLDLHFFSVDSANTDPWWKNLHSSLQIPLNEELIRPLLGAEGNRGVIRRVRMDAFDADIILRWKTKKMEFLSEMKQAAIDQLPCLNELTEPNLSVSSSGLTFLQVFDPLNNDEVKSRETISDEKSQQEEEQPQLQVPAESEDLLSQYKATLEKLRREIVQLRKDKNLSEQENCQLLQHLEAAQHGMPATNSRLRVQLEAMSKGDLVNMIEHLQSTLNQETTQKIYFQQKVHSLQNALIQKNDMENELLVIQKAHTGQQILVHELQRKVKKYRKCYDAWLKQEATIARMEEALLVMAREREKTPPSKPKSAHQQTAQEQPQGALEHHESDTSRETVRALELRLVNALHRISHLEGALQATASFSQRGGNMPQAVPSLSQHYPSVPPFAASSGTELQLQQELIEADAKVERLKQENKTLRTNQEQSNAHPHQEQSTNSDQA